MPKEPKIGRLRCPSSPLKEMRRSHVTMLQRLADEEVFFLEYRKSHVLGDVAGPGIPEPWILIDVCNIKFFRQQQGLRGRPHPLGFLIGFKLLGLLPDPRANHDSRLTLVTYLRSQKRNDVHIASIRVVKSTGRHSRYFFPVLFGSIQLISGCGDVGGLLLFGSAARR